MHDGQVIVTIKLLTNLTTIWEQPQNMVRETVFFGMFRSIPYHFNSMP
jgi:hypothetical protein